MAAHVPTVTSGNPSRPSSVETMSGALFILSSESAGVQVLMVRATDAQASNYKRKPRQERGFLLLTEYPQSRNCLLRRAAAAQARHQSGYLKILEEIAGNARPLIEGKYRALRRYQPSGQFFSSAWLITARKVLINRGMSTIECSFCITT